MPLPFGTSPAVEIGRNKHTRVLCGREDVWSSSAATASRHAPSYGTCLYHGSSLPIPCLHALGATRESRLHADMTQIRTTVRSPSLSLENGLLQT